MNIQERFLDPKVKEALQTINFPSRYIKLCNESICSNPTNSVTKNEVLNVLKNLSYSFKYIATSRLFSLDYENNNHTFRLAFNIKHGIILTYFDILKEGQFLKLGLSHLSFLLNYFDLQSFEIKGAAKYCSKESFEKFASGVLRLFLDFTDEFITLNNK